MSMICKTFNSTPSSDSRYKIGFVFENIRLMAATEQQALLHKVGVSAENILFEKDCKLLDAAKACGIHEASLLVVPTEYCLGSDWGKVFGALDMAGADLMVARSEQLYSCVNGRTFEVFKSEIDKANMAAARLAPKRRKVGARQKLTERQLKNAEVLWCDSNHSATEIAKKYGVAPNYFYRKFGPRKLGEASNLRP